jgi:hypothetical protein
MSKAYKLTSDGVMKKVETWRIVIPRESNDRKEIPKNIIEKILEKISRKWGGWSNYPMEGGWFGNGRMYYDKNFDIVVDIGGLSAINNTPEKFMLDFKDELQKELSQEKIYIKKEGDVEELLKLSEYFDEIGIDIKGVDIQNMPKSDLRVIVENAELIFNRTGYKTIIIQRIEEEKKILWKREILGIQIETKLDDIYGEDSIIIGPDQIGLLDPEVVHGKEIIVLGWKEIEGPYTKIPMDIWITDVPDGEIDKYGYFDQKRNAISRHEFLKSFADSIIINSLILKILIPKDGKIQIVVGNGGCLQFYKRFATYIPCYNLNEKDSHVIINMVKEAMKRIDTDNIEYIKLVKAKIVNNYQKKLNSLISSNLYGRRKKNIIFTIDDKVSILPIDSLYKMVEEVAGKNN